jgi:hypothetical protein
MRRVAAHFSPSFRNVQTSTGSQSSGPDADDSGEGRAARGADGSRRSPGDVELEMGSWHRAEEEEKEEDGYGGGGGSEGTREAGAAAVDDSGGTLPTAAVLTPRLPPSDPFSLRSNRALSGPDDFYTAPSVPTLARPLARSSGASKQSDNSGSGALASSSPSSSFSSSSRRGSAASRSSSVASSGTSATSTSFHRRARPSRRRVRRDHGPPVPTPAEGALARQ